MGYGCHSPSIDPVFGMSSSGYDHYLSSTRGGWVADFDNGYAKKSGGYYLVRAVRTQR